MLWCSYAILCSDGVTCRLGGSNEPPNLWFIYLFIFACNIWKYFCFEHLKKKFWNLLNKVKKKKPNIKPIWSKIWEKKKQVQQQKLVICWS